MGQKNIDRIHTKSQPTKPGIDKEISMETFPEEFNPVALENYVFRDRRNMNVKWTLVHFRNIKDPIQRTQSETPIKVSLSIQTLIQ